jgi:hypothetical protein
VEGAFGDDEKLQFVAFRLANRWWNLGGSLGTLARAATRFSIAARNAESKGLLERPLRLSIARCKAKAAQYQRKSAQKLLCLKHWRTEMIAV